jgi:uncharacterized iron-regulated membrane protein
MHARTVDGGHEKEPTPALSPPGRPRELGRKALLWMHRTIGLFAGAIVVLVGLSGGALVFRDDIDEWLNAPIMRVEIPTRPSQRPLDDILAAAVAAIPANGKLERLTTPRHPGAAAAIRYLAETDDLDADFYEIFVDPYTAKVTGQRTLLHGDNVFSQPPIPIVMAFHWTLLLGANNAYIVGAVGVLTFLSVLMGLYLWRPRNGDWRLGLTIKWRASFERIVYDVHRSVGAYLGAILLVTLFTGVAMIFKPATRAATMLFSPVRADTDFGKSTPIPGRPAIGLDAAVAIADKVFPDGRLHWILLPSAPNGVYVVGKQSSDEPNRGKTYRNVGIDQYSGQVLAVQDRNRFTAGETFLEWLFPLHTGEALGAVGRPLAMVIGLTPLTLYATGFLRWRQKRRARKRAAS